MRASSARIQGSLDLSRGPLIRVGLFRGPANQPGRLLIAVHHLAIDGVSWRVLCEDLETGYRQRVRGESILLPPRSTPFSRWATSLGAMTAPEMWRAELAYWERVGSPASRRLPRDVPADGEDYAADTDTVVVSLDAAKTRALLAEVPVSA